MMKIETDAMREARHALQELTATDPAARANILRYVAAYSLMVTGRRARERRGDEPQTVGGFVLTHGDQYLCAEATRRGGRDQLYIAFDVDDAASAPVAAGVFSKRGEDVVVFGNCRLWSPANDGRALLVPQGVDGYGGYLAFQPGRPFRHVDASLPGDVEAGYRRADARLRRLLASDELRSIRDEGYLHVVRNEGRDIHVNTTPLAA